MSKTSLTHPLHVDFLPYDALQLDGALGLAQVPGRKDATAHDGPWERDLDQDLARLADFYHIDTVVILLERGQFVHDEFRELGISDLLLRMRGRGIQAEWTPLPAGDVPIPIEPLTQLVEQIVASMRKGKTVVLCCRDGRDRSGLVTAATLVSLGADPIEALDTVREIRPGAVQAPSLRQCLNSFDVQWRRRLIARAEGGDLSDVFPAEPSRPSRPSRPSHAPISMVGAATLRYLGVDEEAARAGVTDGPLRRDDMIYIPPGEAVFIGRGVECDVCIASPQLSRVHTLVSFPPVLDERLAVVDLDSRNGTWIEERERTVSKLEVGDTFALARAFWFRFESIG